MAALTSTPTAAYRSSANWNPLSIAAEEILEDASSTDGISTICGFPQEIQRFEPEQRRIPRVTPTPRPARPPASESRPLICDESAHDVASPPNTMPRD